MKWLFFGFVVWTVLHGRFNMYVALTQPDKVAPGVGTGGKAIEGPH
jgi:hypothetical protein